MPLEIKKTVQQMVDEANSQIETLPLVEAMKIHGQPGVTFIDIRDVRELWRDGTIPGAINVTRGMLEMWIDPKSPYAKDYFQTGNKFVFFCAGAWRSALSTRTVEPSPASTSARGRRDRARSPMRCSGWPAGLRMATGEAGPLPPWPRRIARNRGSPASRVCRPSDRPASRAAGCARGAHARPRLRRRTCPGESIGQRALADRSSMATETRYHRHRGPGPQRPSARTRSDRPIGSRSRPPKARRSRRRRSRRSPEAENGQAERTATCHR